MIMNKVIMGLLLFLLLITVTGCASENIGSNASEGRRTVTDLAGRTVSMPADVERVACVTGQAYEKVFLLGGADKIVVRMLTNPPWMIRLNPAAAKIPTTVSNNPGLEELLNRKVQVAFYWDDPDRLRALESAGIAAVVPQPSGAEIKNVTDFIEQEKREVRLYGNVLGDAARQRAEEWCKYYDGKVKYVMERTALLPEEQRPSLYYVRGPGALSTHGRNSNIAWYAELAGAHLVSQHIPGGKVSMEEVLRWNPEYILVGRMYSMKLITNDSRWQNIRAVKAGRVAVLPEGVFYWDGSSEGVLLMEYMAKLLHPELFNDLDMIKEIKEYYKTFYRYTLTDDEAMKILNGLDPDGNRKNQLNN